MKKLLFLSVIVCLFSCSILRHTPETNDDIITYIENGKAATHDLYLRAIISNDKRYDTYKSEYKSIEAVIDSMITLNTNRKYSKKMLLQWQLFKNNFLLYEADHQKRKILNVAQLQANDKYCLGFWNPIINTEKSLK
jgi:hypothetical protein